LFCGTPLAQRIEAAEAKLIVAATEAARARGARGLVLPIAGGYACSAEDGSPMNKLVGIGFGKRGFSADRCQVIGKSHGLDGSMKYDGQCLWTDAPRRQRI